MELKEALRRANNNDNNDDKIKKHLWFLQRREALASQAAQRDAAEIESLVETKTFDLDTHTVSITDVSEVDYVGKSGLHLGNNLVRTRILISVLISTH